MYGNATLTIPPHRMLTKIAGVLIMRTQALYQRRKLFFLLTSMCTVSRCLYPNEIVGLLNF